MTKFWPHSRGTASGQVVAWKGWGEYRFLRDREGVIKVLKNEFCPNKERTVSVSRSSHRLCKDTEFEKWRLQVVWITNMRDENSIR